MLSGMPSEVAEVHEYQEPDLDAILSNFFKNK